MGPRRATTKTGAPLPRGFFLRDAGEVARDLIGSVLTTRVGGVVTSGRVVETEAYIGPEDPAAHGYGSRRTVRNAAMFSEAGTCYVYFIYGMHWCFNAVTGAEGFPAAVLLRALEPMEGIPEMRRRREVEQLRTLCSGPARLCQALGIDGSFNHRTLPDPEIEITCGSGEEFEVEKSPRIGISKAVEWPLRFTMQGSKWLSRKP